MTKRDEVHLLSGAYAVDAVSVEEAALVEAAMRDSEDLHSEVVGLSDTAVALGMALPEVAPPVALRSRLLAAIDSTPQLAAEEPVVAMPTGEHTAPRRRVRRRRPMTVLALVAAAVVLFGGGFFVQRTLMQPQTVYAAINVDPNHQTVTAKVAGGGIATVVWSKSQHATAVVLDGVRSPSGKVLQLWTVKDGVATSAGVYAPTADQRYSLIQGTPNPGESLAVTVEPAGGSTHPTTQPIVRVALGA